MKKLFQILLVTLVAVLAAVWAIFRFAPNSPLCGYLQLGLDACARGREVVIEHLEAAWNQVRGVETTNTTTVVVRPGAAEMPAAAPVEKVAPPPAPKDWKGLERANWYCGKKLTEKALAGKIVMVFAFSETSPDSIALLPRLEQLWSAYKTKPFMLLGSHRGGRSPQVERLVKKARLTFPVYEDAGRTQEPPAGGHYPLVYVVDDKGKLIYRGRSELGATEAFINALPKVGKP